MKPRERTFLLWGRYEPGIVTAIRDGTYSIAPIAGRQRPAVLRCTCIASQLAADAPPSSAQLARLEAGAAVLVPLAGKDAYVQAKLIRHVRRSDQAAEVRRIISDGNSNELVAVRDLRLTVASNATLGDGLILSVGSGVYALHGEWHAAYVERSSQTLGWLTTIAPSLVSAWVSG